MYEEEEWGGFQHDIWPEGLHIAITYFQTPVRIAGTEEEKIVTLQIKTICEGDDWKEAQAATKERIEEMIRDVQSQEEPVSEYVLLGLAEMQRCFSEE